MRRYTISWIHKLPSRWMIQNDSMAISSVKYWNNFKLKQYNKLRLKGAIGTKEIYVNSQASHRFFWHGGLCTWAYSKKIKLSNVWWLLTHKGTSTKSCVLCRDKKGSKRKLYMGYVYSDTFWAFNTKICFKKGACVSLSSLTDSDLSVHGGPAHPDPNFSQPCGLQFELKIGNLSNDDSDGHENGKKQ